MSQEHVTLNLDVNNESKHTKETSLSLAVNFDYGRIMGTASVIGFNDLHVLLVLKEHGTIQVWDVDAGRIVNRFNLNQKVKISSHHIFWSSFIVHLSYIRQHV